MLPVNSIYVRTVPGTIATDFGAGTQMSNLSLPDALHVMIIHTIAIPGTPIPITLEKAAADSKIANRHLG